VAQGIGPEFKPQYCKKKKKYLDETRVLMIQLPLKSPSAGNEALNI
jgi:hypothetical protein